jgi:hypothetical protein
MLYNQIAGQQMVLLPDAAVAVLAFEFLAQTLCGLRNQRPNLQALRHLLPVTNRSQSLSSSGVFWLSYTDNVNLPKQAVQVMCGACKLLYLAYVFQCCKIPLFETEPKDC